MLASAAIIGDADTPVMNGGMLDIRVSVNGQSSDRLFILHQGNLAGQIGISGSKIAFGGIVIGTFSGGTGTTALLIRLNSKATLAAVQALARRISYRNTLAVPSVITRTIQWKLTDGVGGGSIIKLQTVTPIL